MVITAQHRLLSVTTPLGPEAFLLTGFSGREEISRGFRYELEMLSDRAAADARDLVGQEITWSVRPPGGEPRWFHGIVSRLVAGARSVRNLRTYRAVVVPQLWYQAQSARCRIFEDQTVPDIVEAILADSGLTDHAWALSSSYAPRKLRIQYRESDLQFVSRLLEEEGIFFFFQHEEDRTTLVLTDSAVTSEDDVGAEVLYRPGNPSSDRVVSWERQFDGHSTDDWEAAAEVVNGSGGCCRFTPGEAFTLRGHDLADENGAYFLVTVEHAARDVSFTADGGGREYANTFTCLPAAVAFRPACSTPPPTVHGSHLATVLEAPVGGRMRVRFSEGDWDEDAACWVRVIGTDPALPAVGQEVLVEFLAGDPDRPVADCGAPAPEPPAPAPGSAASGNGLRCVEVEGLTEVLLEAGQDCRRVVAQDDSVIVGGAQALKVRNQRTRTITHGDETIRLEKGSRTLTLDEGDETIRLEKGSRTLIVGENYRQQVRKGNHVLVVESGHDVQRILAGNRDICVEKGDETVQINQGNRTVVLEMGNDVLNIKAGNQTTRLDLGRSVTEAMHGIELRVGPSRIALEPTGIVIEGLVVKVHGHAQTQIDGLMTQVGADGVLEVKGGATVLG